MRTGLVALAIAVLLAIGGGLYFALQREEIQVDALGDDEIPGTRTVELVFAGLEGGQVREPREILGGDLLEDAVRHTLQELIAGPVRAGVTVLPRSTRLLNVYWDGEGEITLNLSEHLRTDHPGGSAAEAATVRCLVATLGGNFPEVRTVRILIDGEAVPTLAGHVDLSGPLLVTDHR